MTGVLFAVIAGHGDGIRLGRQMFSIGTTFLHSGLAVSESSALSFNSILVLTDLDEEHVAREL